MQRPERYVFYTDYAYSKPKKRNKMVAGLWVATVLLVVILLISSFVNVCTKTYQNILEAEENVNSAFVNVQSAMQKRVESIPRMNKEATEEDAKKILDISGEIVKYSKTLGTVATADNLSSVNDQLFQSLKQYLEIVEKYPKITSSGQYLSFVDALNKAERNINAAVDEYNIAADEYNKILEHYPGNILAKIYKLEPKAKITSSNSD